MNETTWDRVKRIFHDAMALPPTERDTFLDEACSGDAAVRVEVEGLLAAHDDLGGPDTASQAPVRTEQAGAVIGRYKLLQRIGEGGFGVVYMAEQHEPVRRRVALKIIKLGMDTKQVVARFEAERQALAMMEHPGIAQVLDAGATESGRPYFVMELVRGVPITDYCDRNRLSTSERLRLFVDVCHAIQHAHQKGIIHRDIKPSNVMVTLHDGRPVPKVIDFGVAKATQQRLTEKTVFTAYGQFIGTPAYMSPEQAEMSALDVDTRSDVYSLGVLLYELMVGTTPFDPYDLRSAAYGEIQRILKDVDPQKPSTRLSTLGDRLAEVARHRRAEPETLARTIRGDLDWIVMRALEKDRSRRYASASELAADIVRHFEHEPVVARPPSALYRLRKLAGKHRGPVTAAATVVTAIVVLGSLALWQGLLAQRRARRVHEQSTQVRASSILATAAAVEDPVVKALLLRELGDAPGLRDRLHVAREVANRPVPTAILRGHPGWITDVDFSPDGRRVATAGGRQVRIWDAEGRERPVIVEHDQTVTSVEFSADGRHLLTGSKDGLTRIRPANADGQPIAFRGLLGSFDPDGARVVTASEGSAIVRRVDGAGPPVELSSEAAISAVAFSSDGNRVITGHEDGTTRLWSLDEPKWPALFRGHEGPVTGVWLDVDDTEGLPLATYSADGTLRLWALDGSEPPQVYRRGDMVKGDRKLPEWRQRGNDRSVIFRGGLAAIVQGSFRGSTLAISPVGFLVVDGYQQGAARVWGMSGESLTLHGGETQVLSAAFDSDGARLVTGHADGTARIWSIPGGEPRIFGCTDDWTGCRALVRGRPIGATIAALDADLSPDGSLLATAWSDGSARIRRSDGKGRQTVLQGHAGGLTSIAFSPDGQRVATASQDGEARIWKVDGSGDPLILRHDGAVVAAAFSPDGGRVATASTNGNEARIWSADGTGEPVVLRGPASEVPILSVAFSPDGTRLVTGGPGEAAWVWRADGIGEPVRLQGYEHIWDVAFSPDGKRVAMGCGDGELRIWSADGAGEPVVINEHLDEVFGVAFSPDGTRLASASEDGTIRIHRLDGLQDALVLRGHRYEIRSVRFSRDGSRLLSAGEDGTARLWRITWPGLLGYLEATVRACLTPAERRRFLAESLADAEQAFAECERRRRQ